MDWQRLLEAVVLLTAIVLALVALPRPHLPSSFAAWAVLFSLGLVSALVIAEHTIFSLLEWSWLLLIVILVGYIYELGIDNRNRLDRGILIIALASAFGYLWWFWKLNAFIYFTPLPEGVQRIVTFPGFANIRFFSDYQSFLLLLLPVALNRMVPAGPIKVAAELFTGLFFALALIVGSRSLLVAHCCVHVLMLTLFGKRYWPFLSAQLRFWVYGIMGFVALTKLLPFLMSSQSNSLVASTIMRFDSSFRSDLWMQALQIIKEHPLLGVGPLHYANFPNAIASSPHNFFLQIATEWGIPAFLLLSFLVGQTLYFKIKDLSSSPGSNLEDVSLAITCSCFAIVLQAQVASSPLNYPVGQVIAMICFAYPRQKMQNNLVKSGGSSIGRVMALVGILASLVVINSMTTLQSIKERNRCFYFNPWPTHQFAPRFWQQGWLIGPCGEGESLLSTLSRPR